MAMSQSPSCADQRRIERGWGRGQAGMISPTSGAAFSAPMRWPGQCQLKSVADGRLVPVARRLGRAAERGEVGPSFEAGGYLRTWESITSVTGP